MEVTREQTLKCALAALLHDLGKFWQRSGRPGTYAEASVAFVDEFHYLFLADWIDDLRDAVGNHHLPPTKDLKKIVRLADWLASAEGDVEIYTPQQDPTETPLLSVAARVEFREDKPLNWRDWGYRLNALTLDEACVFPTTESIVSREDYQHLWRQFVTELRRLRPITGYLSYLSFLSLLRKYLSLMPATTPWAGDNEYRTWPDTSPV